MKIENMMVLWDSRGQGGKRGENIMNNERNACKQVCLQPQIYSVEIGVRRSRHRSLMWRCDNCVWHVRI